MTGSVNVDDAFSLSRTHTHTNTGDALLIISGRTKHAHEHAKQHILDWISKGFRSFSFLSPSSNMP
jgi:hypothetical protein